MLTLGLTPSAVSAAGGQTTAAETAQAQTGTLPSCHYSPADDGRPIQVPESDTIAASGGTAPKPVRLSGAAGTTPDRGGDAGIRGSGAERTEDRIGKAAFVAGGLVLAAAIATTAARKARRKRT
ncbi:hypothetical protein [Cohnella nanjingensis]|uniref:Uncharacterized protein n=1 Tax=Cohnella nanjingensis TaxID=1387779 RepID=A0A7X0VGV3_9BACL|nr:hypothetical protein [Cohnella nanjingensis]MBB6673241.1 hypothetical protein [Cohnella nanjingensis]